MNFFEQQDIARRQTGILLFFFFLAILGTILSVYFAVQSCLFFQFTYSAIQSSIDVNTPVAFPFWDLKNFAMVSGIVIVIVLAGTTHKIMQLSDGGSAVAQLLRGELILPNTQDLDERKILNVVEEMAIASGVPVPPVYILKDEKSINAFAAGFSIQDAVIGVTQGAIQHLSRDELQGVIAHEFSHIFNGDMRLNISLTGFLGGLLVIALTGRLILEGFSRGRFSVKGKAGAGFLIVLAFSFLLLVIGYLGVFFGNLIKSAVSRQRELLADATSAQYTRNPFGLAGALKKIGGLSCGSWVRSARAVEVSHFFFADGIHCEERSLFSTHPPLSARIKSLDPAFDGKYPVIKPIIFSEADRVGEKGMPQATKDINQKLDSLRILTEPTLFKPTAAGEIVSLAGMLTSQNVKRAVGLIEQIPAHIKQALQEVRGAQAAIYGLLIERMNSEVRGKQLQYLAQNLDSESNPQFLKLLPDIAMIKMALRLPILELAIPTLKTLKAEEYEIFRSRIRFLIAVDGAVSVFEFALERILIHHLDFAFGKIQKKTPIFSTTQNVLSECATLLTFLAVSGSDGRIQAHNSFRQAMQSLDPSKPWTLASDDPPQAQVEEALDKIQAAFPKVKEQFLKACVICIQQDGKSAIPETEILRAFALTLDCPIPVQTQL